MEPVWPTLWAPSQAWQDHPFPKAPSPAVTSWHPRNDQEGSLSGLWLPDGFNSKPPFCSLSPERLRLLSWARGQEGEGAGAPPRQARLGSPSCEWTVSPREALQGTFPLASQGSSPSGP